MSNKVLFFVNSFSRTGSETLIFEFIQELQKQNLFKIGVVICEKKGDLTELVDNNIPIYFLNQKFSALDKIQFHAGIDVIGNQLTKIQKDFNPTVWYFNTISQCHLLKYRDRFKVKTIVHVHELFYNFESFSSKDFSLILDSCDHLIACSQLVKDLFKPFFTKPITVINSSIKFDHWKEFRRGKNGTSNRKVKIISSGTICYRKGTDIFLKVADILRSPSVEFIWLGKPNFSAFSEIIRLTNEKLKCVTFIETDNEQDYIAQLRQGDIFVSTSREESMGLVMLEAQALGMPILATNSGGSTLLVSDSTGQLVNEFNPENIAIALKEVINNLSKFKNTGKPKFDFELELQKLSILLQNH
jgi:glycosyltransferase involved in cell wall biosynthesis